MNYDSKESPQPCSHCVLMQLVPPEFRSAKTPCRHIPLNEAGEALDTLYRYDDQPEIEESVGDWLRRTIAKLQETRRVAQLESNRHVPAPDGAEMQGTPLFRSFIPNAPTRRAQRLFTGSAVEFFRFRPGEVLEATDRCAQDASGICTA